jgi:homoserine dehydrogenase
MSHYNLSFVGFGNVGQALALLLRQKHEELKTRYDLTYTVTGIATGHHGMAINHDGINLEHALSLVKEGKSLETLDTQFSTNTQSEDQGTRPSQPGRNPVLDFIRLSKANVLFENTPVNYQTGQPAVEYLRTALELGMHAITANKGPVVHAYQTLLTLAKTNGIQFLFESTVMDGAPIFSLFRCALPGARLLGFKGILNSTTNMILTRMESGESFGQAVAYSQSIGLAETDPSGDVDGWDSAIKIAALATVLMDIPFTPTQIDRKGIRGITNEDIARANTSGKRWKLICSAHRHENTLKAQVAPEMVPASSPFYSVEGASSIIQFETDVLSALTIIENDPGPQTTAYGLLADFLNAARG